MKVSMKNRPGLNVKATLVLLLVTESKISTWLCICTAFSFTLWNTSWHWSLVRWGREQNLGSNAVHSNRWLSPGPVYLSDKLLKIAFLIMLTMVESSSTGNTLCSIVSFKGAFRDIVGFCSSVSMVVTVFKGLRSFMMSKLSSVSISQALWQTSGLSRAAATAGWRLRYCSNKSRLLFQRVVKSTISLCSLMSGPSSSFCLVFDSSGCRAPVEEVHNPPDPTQQACNAWHTQASLGS